MAGSNDDVEVQPDGPETQLAAQLSHSANGSEHFAEQGRIAADAVAPDEEKLDEGDLGDYDQEELARQLAEERED